MAQRCQILLTNRCQHFCFGRRTKLFENDPKMSTHISTGLLEADQSDSCLMKQDAIDPIRKLEL